MESDFLKIFPREQLAFFTESCGTDEALNLYRSGLFPMCPFERIPYYAWYTNNPKVNPRGILPLKQLRISKSLKRKELKRHSFDVTCDTAFEDIIKGCANIERGASWISSPIIDLFLKLYRKGHAHSIECWKEGKLVGGLYGLHIGGLFCGESMFSLEPNASKVALVYLVGHLQHQEFSLLDTQMVTGHMASMGAIEIQQKEYEKLRDYALTQDVQWGHFQPRMPET